MDDKMYCSKCKRMLKASDNFFTYKDGRKTEMCKKCLTMHIDNFKPETFLWLLEKMDVPYIPEECPAVKWNFAVKLYPGLTLLYAGWTP